MSFKKSPLQVINLAQMPLDIIKKKGILPRGKIEKKSPEVSELVKRLIYPSSHRLEPPPVKLREVGELGEDMVAVTKGVYQRMAGSPLKRTLSGTVVSKKLGGGSSSSSGGTFGAATYLVKCGVLVALFKWTYDIGVWGNSRQTLALAQLMSGHVARIATTTKYNWNAFFNKDSSSTDDETPSSKLKKRRLTQDEDSEARMRWSYELLRKDQHESGLLPLAPPLDNQEIEDNQDDIGGPLISPL